MAESIDKKIKQTIMNTNMTVGIIGAGNMGSMLAEFFASIGYKVSIANSKWPASLAAFTQSTGIQAEIIENVVRFKDIIIVALPMASIAKLPDHLFAATNKNSVIIDTCNYFPGIRDTYIPKIELGLTESEWISRSIGVPVVKAFNNMTALSLGTLWQTTGAAGRKCLSVAGVNSEQKDIVVKCIDQFGFDAVDAGTLADSWRQQPGAPAYCADLTRGTDGRSIAGCQRR